MFDAEGRRYLDAYNNVPVVGHSHPRVVDAIARQARLLNTNMRYLHGAASSSPRRLLATTPPETRHVRVRQLGQRGERARLAHPHDDDGHGAAAS